jgi:hypothetical protein
VEVAQHEQKRGYLSYLVEWRDRRDRRVRQSQALGIAHRSVEAR